MERISQLEEIHKNCSIPYCKPCTAIFYFHKKDYYMCISYFYQSDEFEVVDMLIFGNYMDYTQVARKNEFIVSWLIGIDLFRNKKFDLALKCLKYASDVDNVRSANETLYQYYKDKDMSQSMSYLSKYLLLLSEEQLKEDYNKGLIFNTCIYYLEENDTDIAYKISKLLDPSKNWISAYLEREIYEKLYIALENKLQKDIVQYIIKPFLTHYIKPFQKYYGKEKTFLTIYEHVLERFESEIKLNYNDQLDPFKKVRQPLLLLYNKACIDLGQKYKYNKLFNKALFWFEKAYDYVKVCEYYILKRNKKAVKRYSDLAIQNRQHKIYHILIDFHIKESEYDEAFILIKTCFTECETFSKGINDLYKQNLPNELKKEIFDFVQEIVYKLEKIEDENDFFHVPINSEDVSPLFYIFGKFYEKGFYCEKSEREYEKYMKLGNKWNKILWKYNSDFANDLSYEYYDDEHYEDYDSDEEFDSDRESE